MEFIKVIGIIKWILASVAAIVLLSKFIYFVVYNAKEAEEVNDMKLFRRYPDIEVFGTTSKEKRNFMLISNMLNNVFWILVLFFVLISIIPKITHMSG